MTREELLDILVCPKCHGKLVAHVDGEELEALACEPCRLVYPVREGIPVMLLEEAVSPEAWAAGRAARQAKAAAGNEGCTGEEKPCAC